jgi:hypothetical protein
LRPSGTRRAFDRDRRAHGRAQLAEGGDVAVDVVAQVGTRPDQARGHGHQSQRVDPDR